MRIAIEAQRLFRKNKHGIEIVALELIRALQVLDKVNEYIIFVKEGEDECLVSTDNFQVIKLPNVNYAWWEQAILPGEVKKYSPDLLHCTGNTAPVRKTVKTLLTIHDIFFTSFANIKGSPYQVAGNLYRKLIFPGLAGYDHLVTVSETEKKNIVRKLGISGSKIDVIYNGVNPMFKPIKDEAELRAIKDKYALPAQFVLYFANTAPKKNTERVLHAFSQLVKKDPSIHLVVTDPSGDYVRGLLDKMNVHGMKDKVHVLGYAAHDDLPALYNLATCYLFPSIEESFGLPIAEAQACGTPVITSNISAMPEISRDAALLVDPFNVNEISNAVEKLWLDESCRSNLVQKGFQNVKRFDWNNAAQRLRALYGQLV
jgi:glycosyltransferase involved in cell wall biosynthesis